MGRTPQEDARIEQRRTQVAELYLKAWTQASIAGELHVCQATISSDLKSLRHEWSESRIRNLDEVREEQLRKSNGLLREAWNAWEQSKEPAKTTRANMLFSNHHGFTQAIKDLAKGEVRRPHHAEISTGFRGIGVFVNLSAVK